MHLCLDGGHTTPGYRSCRESTLGHAQSMSDAPPRRPPWQTNRVLCIVSNVSLCIRRSAGSPCTRHLPQRLCHTGMRLVVPLLAQLSHERKVEPPHTGREGPPRRSPPSYASAPESTALPTLVARGHLGNSNTPTRVKEGPAAQYAGVERPPTIIPP